MAHVTLGNHAAVVVSATEQDAVRRFYRDVLGCALTRSADDKDDFVLGGDFYLAVVYADEAVTLGKEDFLKATYLELRTDNVEEVQQQIIDFGVKVIQIDDPHLYFQAPAGKPSGSSARTRTCPDTREPRATANYRAQCSASATRPRR